MLLQQNKYTVLIRIFLQKKTTKQMSVVYLYHS